MISFIRDLLFGSKEEIAVDMKYLVVGLGNMHPDYDGTRHNIGFEVVDLLAQEYGGKFKNDTLGDLAMIKHKGRHIYLLKPSTYMNRSGKAVRYWMQKLKVKADKVLIIVDDLNLDLGKLRLRAKGANGGHNGLKDIEHVLATSKYPRLRFGIGNDFSKGRQVDFVLGKWTSDELDNLGTNLTKAAEAVLS
ncbi:MAG: aminoacyl-tRNA hydrolase, partial [Saprospiraceae bacterium]|nr:aminoacyl-tRNA hydrolase [Saprospiraceae bacterium]